MGDRSPADPPRADLLGRGAMRLATPSARRLCAGRAIELLADLVFTTSGWRRSVSSERRRRRSILTWCDRARRASLRPGEVEDLFGRAGAVRREVRGGTPRPHVLCLPFKGGGTDNEGVTVVGPEKLAALVMEAGLMSWLKSDHQRSPQPRREPRVLRAGLARPRS